MCLTCSGVHRGLGVHISFVRSITMDAFKPAELQRMSQGGNKPWRAFFDTHSSNKLEGRTFDDSTIQERYDSDAAEEWRERLTCKIEARDFVPSAKPKPDRPKKLAAASTPQSLSSNPASRSQTPLGRTRTADSLHASRAASPALGTASLGKKAQNEAYFARMGQENASRPEDVPPNQGGKYAGFGSDPFPQRGGGDAGALPDVAAFQKDPVAALTKGFGWLSSTVTKNASAGYEGWVKPGMQKVRVLLFFCFFCCSIFLLLFLSAVYEGALRLFVRLSVVGGWKYEI